MKYDLMLEITEDRSDDLGSNLTLGELVDLLIENERLSDEGYTLQIVKCYA